MKGKLLIVLLSLTFLVVFPGLALAQFGSISGRVIDEETGFPIMGAHVWARGDTSHPGGHGFDITDSAGLYVIDSLHPGAFLVSASAQGYEGEAYPESVIVVGGQNTPNIDFALTPVSGEFGSISGQVTDEVTGHPIAGAAITVSGIWCVWYTDSAGHYICDSIPAGAYEVNAYATGYYQETYPESVIVIEGQNTPNIDFALTPIGEMGSISGRVTDEETGLPLPMAHVWAHGGGDAWTDTAGLYLIENLVPGHYVVGVHKPGYEDEVYPESVTVEEGQNTPDIDFALTPIGEMGSISGQVTDEETGLPLPMAHVLAYDSTHCVGHAWTDTAGLYLIQNLAAGQYIVGVHKDGYEDEVYPESVIVEEGQNTPDIDFALTPLGAPEFGSISGRVTDEQTGLPIIMAEITITGIYCIWYTDTAGYYFCDSLPPGSYLVNAQKEGYIPETYPDSVIVMPGENSPGIDFALTPIGGVGSISGMVTDEVTGRPIVGAGITLSDLDCIWFTDSTGYYICDNVPVGVYEVSASAAGYYPETYPDSVGVIEGQNTPNIDFALTPMGEMGSISGQVTDEETDLPLPMAHVLAYDSTFCAGDAWTDTAGYYLIQNLVAGQYIVGVHKDGYEDEIYPESVTVEEGQNTPDIDFALTPIGEYGSISGRVTDEETGLPIIMAHLVAIGLDNWCFGEAWSDTGGYYMIPNLCAGTYQVNANKPGYVPETYPDSIIVLAGKDTPDIDFALTPMGEPGSISGTVTDAENGEPIPYAQIYAHGEFGYGQGITDSLGQYIIFPLCPGYYFVTVWAWGYWPQEYPDTVSVIEGQNTPGIDFALVPHGGPGEGIIAGQVFEDTTFWQPIPYAIVFAISSYGNCGFDFTDSAGAYMIQGLQEDDYYVYAFAPGYIGEFYDGVYTWEEATLVTPDADDIDFYLAPCGYGGGRISGVINSDGSPVEGAFVYAEASGEVKGFARSSTEGGYVINGLLPGTYTVSASKVMYHDGSYPDPVVVGSGKVSGIDIELPPIQVGEVTGDEVINAADVVFLIDYLYKNGPAPEPLMTGDVNCDEVINSADVVYLINYLFKEGPSPCNP